MKTQSLLALFLVLCGGNPPGLRAKSAVYTATEGGNITVRCLLNEDGIKVFSKNEGDNILVEASESEMQKSRGRYSLKYDISSHVMEVSITDVVKSDSGEYSCEIWSQGGAKLDEEDFKINVTFAPKPSSSTALRSTLTSPVNDVSPSAVSAVSSEVSNGTRTEQSGPSSGPSSTTGVVLCVSLAALLILLSVSLCVLLLRRRRNKPKALTENSKQIQNPESHHLYEEIPDQDRPAPVYSLLTPPQVQTHAEVSIEPTYTEVGLPQSSSAPCCQTELYSTISSTQ